MKIEQPSTPAAPAAAATPQTPTGDAPNDPASGDGGGAAPTPASETTPAPAPKAAADSDTPAQAPGFVLTGKDDTDTGGDGAAEPGREEGGTKDEAEDGEYRFQYPEGFTGNPEAEGALRDLARAHNLPAEAQQALADIHVRAIQAMNERQLQELADLKRTWRENIESDPEFGGAHLKQTGKDANWALRTFFPELIDYLPQWNLEAQPDLIRGLARVKRAFKENTSPKAENPALHKPKTLVDQKRAMLAEEERKNRR